VEKYENDAIRPFFRGFKLLVPGRPPEKYKIPDSTHAQASVLRPTLVSWLERPPVVGRHGFDSLVESYQKTLKVGIHTFPSWLLLLEDGAENKLARSLVVSLGKALLKDASSYE